MELFIFASLGLGSIALAAFAIVREVRLRSDISARTIKVIGELRQRKTG